jgi:Uma2 family endonuclease
MTTSTQKLTLTEYLNYSDGTDNRYELVDGELKLMGVGTGQHGDLVEFLKDLFRDEIKRSQLPWTSKQAAVSIQSPRGRRWDTCRIPDVVVLSLDQWESLRNCEALITLDQNPPILVVEVVSPSTKTEDYRSKRVEYCVLEIAEYWIVDPLEQRVTVCVLEEGSYTDYVFSGDDAIASPVFPTLNCTAAQILTATNQ